MNLLHSKSEEPFKQYFKHNSLCCIKNMQSEIYEKISSNKEIYS